MSQTAPAEPGGSAAPGRWAPFPVQDWASMPGEGAGRPPDRVSPDWVSPDWGPPQPPRRGWPPVLITLLALALVAAGLAVADSGNRPVADRGAARFVPADGGVGYRDRTTATGGQTLQTRVVTESARITGAAAVLANDATFGTRILGSVGSSQISGHRFWRTTTTEIGSDTASQQAVAFYRVERAVELLAESAPGVARTYAPALVELPADVSDGAQWSGGGAAGIGLTYRSSFTARAVGGACLDVTGTIRFLDTVGQPAGEQQQRKLWCRGDGAQQSSTTYAGTTTVDRLAARPPDREIRTVTEPYGWSDPAQWRNRVYESMSIDPNFGEGVMAGTSGNAPPVVAASGLVIRPSSTDDLVVFTPKTATAWTSIWRMRPGGRVLSLASFGDVVVATTSQRQVVGYTDAGVRLWALDLPEIAFAAPVRLSATEAAVVDAAGHVVALDLRSGTERWRTEVGAEVTAAPAAGDGAIVVLDGSGSVSVLAAADGSVRWRAEVKANRAVVVGDTLVLHDGSTLLALAMADGRYRWTQPSVGTVDALTSFGGRIVVATRLGSTVFAVDGSVLARRQAWASVTVNGDYLIGWGATEAQVLGPDLAQVAVLDTPDQTAGSSPIRALPYRQGVWMFTEGWTLQAWTDEP